MADIQYQEPDRQWQCYDNKYWRVFMLFGKNRKDEPHKEDIFLAKGIYVKQPVMDNGHIILNCFLRSLIVFALVFGTIGGFLSAFDISYNYVLVIFFYLVLSMYFSFLYASSKLLYRDIGYIAFFIVFIFSIFQLRYYANSGFYAIVNAILKRAQEFFELSGVREFETTIDRDYITIAVVSIFIGMVLIIILNIWLYSSMSLGWTVILTFPFMLIPLYMKLLPDASYMLLLAVGYLAVVIFKANGHYIMFAWDTSFHLKGLKKNRISYTQDSKVFGQILITVAVLAFCMIFIVQMLFPSSLFERSFKKDRLRDVTKDAIGNFVLLGFDGLYNHYSAAGGLSGGQLGGVSNVRPDYQTDLVVSYTPYNNAPVYLKGYTGGLYSDNKWESLYGGFGPVKNDVELFKDESMAVEANRLYVDYLSAKEHSAEAKMDIRNVGANTAYLYYPYYTVFEDYSIYENHELLASVQGIDQQEMKSYTYYPKVVWEESYGDMKPSEIHIENVDSVYMNVPEKNRVTIANTCLEMGLTPDMTENEIVDTVKMYFDENIPYTLKPGATPRGKDFINFFLEKNRKGYCAHFASAATLIFRQMGIPARYVEGYAFNLEAALASDINEYKEYKDYYQGYSDIGESAVLDVEVTDAMAHAWVEIYVEGFGWKPVEVTPGSNETGDEEDFWAAFTNMLDKGGLNIGDMNGNGIGNLSFSQFSWLGYVLIILAAGIVFIMILRILIRKYLRYRKCHQKDKKEAAIACYADLCEMIRLCHANFDLCKSHMEQLDFMDRTYRISFDKIKMCREIEKISFSTLPYREEELKEIMQFVQIVRKMIWKQADIKEKLMLYKR